MEQSLLKLPNRMDEDVLEMAGLQWSIRFHLKRAFMKMTGSGVLEHKSLMAKSRSGWPMHTFINRIAIETICRIESSRIDRKQWDCHRGANHG